MAEDTVNWGDCGLVVTKEGRMFWGVEHGWGRWLPDSARHVICHAWNKAACWWLGCEFVHVDGTHTCMYCCRLDRNYQL